MTFSAQPEHFDNFAKRSYDVDDDEDEDIVVRVVQGDQERAARNGDKNLPNNGAGTSNADKKLGCFAKKKKSVNFE